RQPSIICRSMRSPCHVREIEVTTIIRRVASTGTVSYFAAGETAIVASQLAIGIRGGTEPILRGPLRQPKLHPVVITNSLRTEWTVWALWRKYCRWGKWIA